MLPILIESSYMCVCTTLIPCTKIKGGCGNGGSTKRKIINIIDEYYCLFD